MSTSAGGLTGVGGEPTELRISLASASETMDVLVRASAGITLGELASAAARELGGQEQRELWCERRGTYLDAHDDLKRSGVRWGDRLILMPPAAEPTRVGGTASVELVVTGGPCAGDRFELGEGRFELGREPGLDISIKDPSLSRRHLEVVVEREQVLVSDIGSSNGSAVGGVALPQGRSVSLADADELEMGRTLVRIRPLRSTPDHGVAQRDGRLDFNRPPRVSAAEVPFSRELDAAPSRGRKARLPLAASLIPVGAGVLLFVLLKSPVMLAIAGLSPMMAIGTFISDRRGGRKSFAQESTRFRATVDDAVSEFGSVLADEAVNRRAEAPDAPTVIARVEELATSLWERRPGERDFLVLRLGVADLPPRATLTLQDGGDEELREEAVQKIGSVDRVRSVPLTVDLKATPILGISGRRDAVARLARWLVVQAAAFHSPGELVIMATLGDSSAAEWGWLKWLPHLRPDRVGLHMAAVSSGRSAGEELLVAVGDLVSKRRELARSVVAQQNPPAHLLLLLDEDADVDRAILSAALIELDDRAVSVIWLGRSTRDLPGQTTAIADLEGERAVLTLTDVRLATRTPDVSAEGMPLGVTERCARLLAPVRDISERARAGDIPRRVQLLDLLSMLPPTPESLEARWNSWRGALAATVGVAADGPITFDLRSEGPHALIAGTTGSGKSELLRTLVAAAAVACPPNRLTFLLVDYKGGAAFAPCAALPHVVDIVSDLDEHLAERALVSLNAELKRRERILAEEGARDLQELWRRAPETAPPLLVIAVDEFAKLREEVPQFVDGVVDIAQRGRSLGVHMVLAAQTLRNAFTPAIRANTNLRVALRVAEEAESEDMIASPSAARIPSGDGFRGRGYARTGHGELREFQAAYISGRSEFGVLEAGLEIEAFDVEHGSALDPSGGGADSDLDSDLVLLGEAAKEAQRRMGLLAPPAPWLPVLPTVLDLALLPATEGSGVGVGLIDVPQRQLQTPLVVDLERTGHVAVFGAGGSGKTSVLRSTALALARRFSCEELNIYGLDAASGALSALEGLDHCGGVVRVSEEERVHRLMRMLLGRIEGQDDGGEASGRRTVLLLDDIGSFNQTYDRPGLEAPAEQLGRILANGRPAGVHVILTASRRAAVPSALAAHLGQRLVLRMPTEEDMLALGLDAKIVRGAVLPPGRGFTQDNQEFHVAVSLDGDGRPATGPAVEALTESRAHVPRIEVLPSLVESDSLSAAKDRSSVPVGLRDSDLTPAHVDLSEMHMLVIGPYRTGRTTALATLAQALDRAVERSGLHLISPRRNRLRDLDIWETMAAGIGAAGETTATLLARLEAEELNDMPEFLFIDDASEISDALTITQLERIVRLARDSSLRVLAAVETGGARGVGNAWIREMRREGHGLLIQPDLAGDGDLLGVRLPRRVAAPPAPGRGFIVSRGEAELVQIAI